MSRRVLRHVVLAALALALAACASAPLRRAGPDELSAQRAREAALGPATAWGLVGRIAFKDERESGSGRIEWRESGDRFEIVLTAPVSRQGWRLSGGPGWALLEGLDGGPRRGESAEALLAREVGWSMPLEPLRAWARGLRTGEGAHLSFGEGALPERLVEHGWTVRYRDWFAALDPPLPRRVFAEREERQLRLVVERWLAPGQVGSLQPAG